MTPLYSRRRMLQLTGRWMVAGAAGSKIGWAAAADPSSSPGLVAGQVKAAEAGNKVLREGGNAIDAIVAAALVAGVSAPNGCGIGGYGGHMVIALARGKKITAIDFNSTAPAAATAGMFPVDEDGTVRGKINEHGWLAAGVPGILGGLQLALDRYGTLPLRTLIAPAIQLADEGLIVTDGLSRAIRAVAVHLRRDPASARLLLPDGTPLSTGDTLRNPDLARMLEKLAQANTVEPFYRGDIGRQIGEEFQKHGGLVTAKDMAAYQAREVKPLEFNWRGFTIRTAPLTAGGLTVFEALSFLKALGWERQPAGRTRDHAMVEALRVAWDDRLRLLGDPKKSKVPIARLLSSDYAESVAEKISAAVKDAKPLPMTSKARPQTGTIHLNSVDAKGNTVALTLTHGATFGACVTVEGLGLTLGHGMSRFDPEANHPNSPGPGKRPLHNMCPTIVLRGDKPVLAVGATGGRKIPNAIFGVLTQFVGLDATAAEAVAQPRLHTEGGLDLTLERAWPESGAENFKSIGYNVSPGPNATVQSIAMDIHTQSFRATAR